MRALAEWLAMEELAQAARLRRRWRQSYRAQGVGEGGGAARAPNPLHIDSLVDLLSAAAVMEEQMARHLAKIGQLEKDEDEALHAHEIRLALTESERAFAFYDAVVGAAANEAVMLEAQRLSQEALQVISTIRSGIR